MAELPLIDLNRPQYVMAPEAFITALAWTAFRRSGPAPQSSKPLAYIYRSERPNSRTLDLRTTYPEGKEVERFISALNGIRTPEPEQRRALASAVASSIQGTRPKKGKSQLASPLTPHLALLQDVRGFQGTANPPDYGKIIQTLYQLGIPRSSTKQHPASLWLRAAELRCATDPLLARIDAAVAEGMLPFRVEHIDNLPELSGTWDLDDTPFSWFVASWNRLTSEAWVNALPARVWVDWATTVLRLAFGLGYLWEATWYEAFGRQLVSGGSGITRITNPNTETVPWRPSDARISVRDVAGLLSWRVRRGNRVRDVLQRADQDQGVDPEDPALLRDIEAALNNPGTAVNTWEAIRYALLTRDVSGPFADHYGLLRSSGRYLWVQPGTEWMAVVASLACESPGGSTDVRRVMVDLRSLGLRPELRDVLILLEAAGLARGSADADYGVEVHSAF